MNYYRIINDLELEDGWVLGDILVKDVWKYSRPKEFDVSSSGIEQEIFSFGPKLDFSINASNTITVSELAASIFEEKEVQKIPVRFSGNYTEDKFFILSIKHALDCIDEKKSEYEIWEVGNKIRPDKAGQFSSFFKMVIKQDFQTNLKIFRIKKYNTGIVVSEEVKRKFESLNFTGAAFIKL